MNIVPSLKELKQGVRFMEEREAIVYRVIIELLQDYYNNIDCCEKLKKVYEIALLFYGKIASVN